MFFLKKNTTVALLAFFVVNCCALSSENLELSNYVNFGLQWITNVSIEIKNGAVWGTYKEKGYNNEPEIIEPFVGKVIYSDPKKFNVKAKIFFINGNIPYEAPDKKKIIWVVKGRAEEASLFIPKEDYILELQDVTPNE